MSLLEFFGRGVAFNGREERPPKADHYLPLIEHAPPGVEWRNIHPRPARDLRAWRAERDGQIAALDGNLRYHAGRDWIVEHGDHDYAIVRAEIFDRTYAETGPDRYRKRTDVHLRYFKLPHAARIKTSEGVRLAH